MSEIPLHKDYFEGKQQFDAIVEELGLEAVKNLPARSSGLFIGRAVKFKDKRLVITAIVDETHIKCCSRNELNKNIKLKATDLAYDEDTLLVLGPFTVKLDRDKCLESGYVYLPLEGESYSLKVTCVCVCTCAYVYVYVCMHVKHTYKYTYAHINTHQQKGAECGHQERVAQSRSARKGPRLPHPELRQEEHVGDQ